MKRHYVNVKGGRRSASGLVRAGKVGISPEETEQRGQEKVWLVTEMQQRTPRGMDGRSQGTFYKDVWTGMKTVDQ